MAGRYLVTGSQLGSLIVLCKLDAVKCKDLLNEITEKQFIGESKSLIEEDVDNIPYFRNEVREDKKLTKRQIIWVIDDILSGLNNFRNRCRDEREVTVNNYKSFDEDIFLDLPHSHYLMLISLLDALK